MEAVSADFVITMTGEVHAPGWVVIDKGRIKEVHGGAPPPELRDHPGDVHRFLLPGLGNAHAHLPLGGLAGLGAGLPFFDWIHRAVLPAIEELFERPESFLEGARHSVRELVGGGVTLVADGFLRADGPQAMREAGLPGIFFQEVFGSLAEDEDAYVARVTGELDRLPDVLGEAAFGYAPHTPWTCPEKTLRVITDRAREEGRPLTIHLDESIEEHECFRHERGPLHGALKKRGVQDRFRFGLTPTAYLEELGVLGPDLLAVHCVQIDEQDIERLLRSGTRVVHCPVSNMRLAEGVAPILPLLEAGVPVCLGTDSSASAGPLDMFAQMRTFLLAQRARYGTVGPLTARTALGLATTAVAEALGRADETGAIAAGMRADLMTVDLPEARVGRIGDPYEAVVSCASAQDVVSTWIAGRARAGHGARRA